MSPAKMGRPRRARKESEERFVARCTVVEFCAANAQALALGISLSEFVRRAVDEKVKRGK